MTAIEWTHMPGYRGETWNPVTGCTKVSAGCKYCYAERNFPRPYARTGRKFTDIATYPERLDRPLRATKPRCYFVNSMSDLFHEDVPDEFIDQVFAVMALSPQHRFLILTKRPERMRAYLSFTTGAGNVLTRVIRAAQQIQMPRGRHKPGGPSWPYRNVYLGVSVEDQATADERIPLLLDTPAAVRFVSCEPLLSEIDLSQWLGRGQSDDRGGDGISRVVGARNVLGGRGREDLAPQGVGARQQDRGGAGDSGSQENSPRGCESVGSTSCRQHELPAGDVRVEGEALEGECASRGLDDCERADDPRRVGDQSPERERRGQSAAESRSGISVSEHDARDTNSRCAEEGACGNCEPVCDIDQRSGNGNSAAIGSQDDAAARDRCAVRSVTADGCEHPQAENLAALAWAIVGGESGPKARPFDVAWAYSTIEQCRAAGVPVFLKQIGAQPRHVCAGQAHCDDPDCLADVDYCDLWEASEGPRCRGRCAMLVDRKGKDMAEWPADLRVREWPR